MSIVAEERCSWCSKCQGLYVTGSVGTCPSGGTHGGGSYDYFLLANPIHSNMQVGWTSCNKCKGIYYTGWNAGVCPNGGSHTSIGTRFSLIHTHSVPDLSAQQSNWRWCQNCQGLFYAGWPNSCCPNGGSHHIGFSFDYFLSYGMVAIRERIIDPIKDAFEKDQMMLESILNNGYDSISKRQFNSAMAIGPSGTGKSTTLNVFYGGNFDAAVSFDDVTVEMTSVYSTQLNMDLIDTVGFLPTLANIGKMFVLLFHRGIFPDHLIYPANNNRIVDIIELKNLIDEGFIKVTIIPFNAKVYYVLKGLKLPEDEVIRQSLEKTTIPDIKKLIDLNLWKDHIEICESDQPPTPVGSMREVFLKTFFCGGRYKPITYDLHKRQMIEGDRTAKLRDCMIESIKHLRRHADIINGKTETIDERGFLKG